MRKIVISSIVGLGLMASPALMLEAQVPAPTAQPSLLPGQAAEQTGARVTGTTPIQRNQLPEKVRRVIDSQTGGSSISSLVQGVWSGPAYQVTINRGGNPVVLQIAERSGTILNNQPGHPVQFPLVNGQPLNYSQLPQRVRTTVNNALAGGSVQSVEYGTWNGTVYRATLASNPNIPVLVTADGTILRSPNLTEAAGATPAPALGAGAAAGTAAGAAAATQPGTGAVAQQPGVQPAQPGLQPGQPAVTGTTTEFEDLPYTVQKPMLDRSGNAHISNVQQYTLPDGRIAYRGVYQKGEQQREIRVAKDGQFLSDQALAPDQAAGAAAPSVLEFKDLPWPVQQSMMKASGSEHLSNVRQLTLPNGQSGYTAMYEKNNQTHQVQVTQDGTLLGDQVVGQ